MDTKWKNMNSEKNRQAAPFILWLSLALMIIALSNILRLNLGVNYITDGDFVSSHLLQNQNDQIYNMLVYHLSDYRSEDYIRAGHTIDEYRLQEKMEDMAIRELEESGYYYKLDPETPSGGYFYFDNGDQISPFSIILLSDRAFIPKEGDLYEDDLDGYIQESISEYMTRYYNEEYIVNGSAIYEYITGSNANADGRQATDIATAQAETLSEEAVEYTTTDEDSLTGFPTTNYREYVLENRGERGEPGLSASENGSSVVYNPSLQQVPRLSYKEYVQTYEAQARAQLIEQDLDYFWQLLDEIEAPGIYYYISIGGYETSNIESLDALRNLPNYGVITASDTRRSSSDLEGTLLTSRWTPGDVYINGWAAGDFISYGFDDDLTINIRNNWHTLRGLSIIFYALLCFAFLLFACSAVYLFHFMGKRALADAPAPRAEGDNGPPPGLKKEKRPFRSFVYADIALILSIFAFFLPIAIFGEQRYYYYYRDIGAYDFSAWLSMGNFLATFLAGLLFGGLTAILLYGLLWDTKNKRLIKHSLAYHILDRITYLLANISNFMNLGYKLVSARKLKKVKEGIERIKGGDFTTPITIRGHGHMAQLAAGLNEISEGFNIAVENRIKSERLKTELISNVSHDIRTPLTSIITYVDLLKKDDATREEQMQYLEVLESKTARLKVLVDDLFEASKASSGNIVAELIPTDIYNVLEQAMGELEDKIEASGLDFKISQSERRVAAIADGKLLWRVMHNLFSNIFKYSMANSRVYIDILDGPEYVSLIFKNMSAYELNITADELMERCTRGDQSRNSEGSGLGLNIAKSLVQIMEGEFILELDGDLFKVIILLPKAEI